MKEIPTHLTNLKTIIGGIESMPTEIKGHGKPIERYKLEKKQINWIALLSIKDIGFLA